MLQTQLEIDKALQEDPSVYEYDNIYDDIQAKKVSSSVKEANKKDKKVRPDVTLTFVKYHQPVTLLCLSVEYF